MLAVVAGLAFCAPKTVRVGEGQAHPYIYTQPNGEAGGFVAAVISEAARREGLRLEWTPTGSTAENTQALAEGRLHILPLALSLPERRRLLYVSEPWWSEETIVLVRGDAPHVDPRSLRRLALPELLLSEASRTYRPEKWITTRSAPQSVEMLCRGAADGAMMGSTYIRELVNARPAACESVRLRILDSAVQVNFTITANPGWRAEAERLRERISEMTADGTLARIAGYYPGISSPHATRMTEALRARYEKQRLTTWLVFLTVLLGVGLLALLRQITAQRRLRTMLEQQMQTEEELRESQSELHRRTVDLVRSNEDLQAFAYSVSHDLQEPVRNQALYTELLMRRYGGMLPAEGRHFIEVIRASALRTQHMMRSLLGYSRVGQADLPPVPVDCGVAVQRVVQDLAPQLAEAGATVHVDPLPVVPGRAEQLQQVFQNLIHNGIKYRQPDVPPRIAVSAAADGEYWRFSVSDNGIGFRQEYAERIFNLFRRLHTQDRYSGSGIGLALCRRLVERHGGRIWAESREGEGSTFFFTVRAGSPDIAPAESTTETSRAGAARDDTQFADR